jgi:5-methylcytosine-specific restriction protein A
MTVATQQLCSFPGCAELVNKGKCPEHKQVLAKDRRQVKGSAWAQGYDWEWTKARKRALARDHYLCQHCLLRDDRMIQATEVDHIVPFKGNIKSPLRLALSNLQSVGRHHHSEITAIENGGFGRAPRVPNQTPAGLPYRFSAATHFGFK